MPLRPLRRSTGRPVAFLAPTGQSPLSWLLKTTVRALSPALRTARHRHRRPSRVRSRRRAPEVLPPSASRRAVSRPAPALSVAFAFGSPVESSARGAGPAPVGRLPGVPAPAPRLRACRAPPSRPDRSARRFGSGRHGSMNPSCSRRRRAPFQSVACSRSTSFETPPPASASKSNRAALSRTTERLPFVPYSHRRPRVSLRFGSPSSRYTTASALPCRSIRESAIGTTPRPLPLHCLVQLARRRLHQRIPRPLAKLPPVELRGFADSLLRAHVEIDGDGLPPVRLRGRLPLRGVAGFRRPPRRPTAGRARKAGRAHDAGAPALWTSACRVHAASPMPGSAVGAVDSSDSGISSDSGGRVKGLASRNAAIAGDKRCSSTTGGE